mgnify:CR=1 FL=1
MVVVVAGLPHHYTVGIMTKLRHFFYGYQKQYLAWMAIFVFFGVAGIFLGAYPVYAVLAYIVIGPPIPAFITLSIYKGLRGVFGSKDFM